MKIQRLTVLAVCMQMLQGPSSSLQMQLANTLNFHDLVDRQIRICDAECDAIVKYTANFTRTDVSTLLSFKALFCASCSDALYWVWLCSSVLQMLTLY